MKKAEEYRVRAAECLTMAHETRNSEHKSHLLKLAEAWEKLAEEREATKRKKSE